MGGFCSTRFWDSDHAERIKQGRVLTLYHQTSYEAAQAILNSNMKRGSVGSLGGAIYFAESASATHRKAHVSGCILRAHVAVGRVKHISSTRQFDLKSLIDGGYDSVRIDFFNSGPEWAIYDNLQILKVWCPCPRHRGKSCEPHSPEKLRERAEAKREALRAKELWRQYHEEEKKNQEERRKANEEWRKEEEARLRRAGEERRRRIEEETKRRLEEEEVCLAEALVAVNDRRTFPDAMAKIEQLAASTSHSQFKHLAQIVSYKPPPHPTTIQVTHLVSLRDALIGKNNLAFNLASVNPKFVGHPDLAGISPRDMYKEASDAGFPTAQYNYGRLLLETTPYEAVALFEKAAEGGSSHACVIHGELYDKGVKVEADQAKAEFYYAAAAKMGDGHALCVVGRAYEEGRWLYPEDSYKARSFYERSAEKGDPGGLYAAGYCWHLGFGGAQCFDKAFNLYKRAADLGNMFAQNNLGRMYENGQGVKRDVYAAVRHYRQSADQGCYLGLANLARFYQSGRGGCGRDPEEARRLEAKSEQAKKGQI